MIIGSTDIIRNRAVCRIVYRFLCYIIKVVEIFPELW